MRPSLIHPQRVTVALLDRDASNKDDDFVEPIQRLVKKIITISAQVNYGSPAKVELVNAVAFAGAMGYLVAHNDSLSQLIHQGDNITSVNGEAVKFRIGQTVPQGFYPGQSTLLYIPFFEG